MNKPLFVISCPYDTYSGYGARSRDLVKSIIKSEKYDVKLLPQRWGTTPFGFCNDNPEWSFLNEHKIEGQLSERPKIWMQISVPNEFQPIGEYNIGVTAGMETTLVDGSWVEGINRMDLNLVSSNHSKQSFLNSSYERRNQQGQVVGKVEIEKPIEVLFEGANIETYFPDNSPCMIDFDIPESFAYLFVGHWLSGNLGEDRKNVGLLVKAFYETFKNKRKKPALILKTASGSPSHMDRDSIIKRIKDIQFTVNSNDLPNVYLLHGDFSDEEMNSLYNHSKVKAMVSLTKGEGFGRPLLEFSLTKKPILTTNWSGHTDFLNPEFTTLLGGNLTKVDNSAVIPNMILPEAEWFSVNHAEMGHKLKDMFENYKKYVDGAKRQAYHSKTNFSWEKMDELLNEILDKNIPHFPTELELQLPNLDL